MKYYELDKEEKMILKDYESGKLKSIRNFKEKKAEVESSARAMLDKTRNVNIRLSERDLFSLKSRAIEKGLPYQTLLASVLHQYSTGSLLEREQRVSSARR